MSEVAEKEKREKREKNETSQRAYLQRASRDRAEVEGQALRGKKTPDEAEKWLAEKNAEADMRLRLPHSRQPGPCSLRSYGRKRMDASDDGGVDRLANARCGSQILERLFVRVQRVASSPGNPRGKANACGRATPGRLGIRKCKLVSLHDVIHEASRIRSREDGVQCYRGGGR